MKDNVIHINLDVKCSRCGKGGATEGGVCLACIAKAMANGEFDNILKQHRDELQKKLKHLPQQAKEG